MSCSRILMTCAVMVAAWHTPKASAAVPVVQNVFNAASFQPGFASSTWISVTGTNLATSTRPWGESDFSAGNLPTKLDDVQVTINSKPAYISFISPGQINVLAPDDAATGQVAVQVTNSLGTSNSFQATRQAVAPGIFNYSQLGGIYAVVQANATFELVAPPGALGTARTVTATPGESIVLYATGLGAVTPPQPAGRIVGAPAATASPVTVLIGNQPATVQFAGLVGSGLYQINVVVPSLPSGDAPVSVSVNGVASKGRANVPVQALPGPAGNQTSPQISSCLTGRVDYITYSVSRLSWGQPDEVSIAGTRLCPTCSVKPPLYPEFAARMEKSMGAGKNIRACYDAGGTIFQIGLAQP
jgi:uncharacterized protein (TIGR03437 family)